MEKSTGKKVREEPREARLLRGFLTDNYDTDGPRERMELLTTAELMYRAAGTVPSLTLPVMLDALERLGARQRDIGGVAHWVLYARRDPSGGWI